VLSADQNKRGRSVDVKDPQPTEGLDDRRPYTDPQLTVEGQLEELTMVPTFLLEAYG
jgi:hypothetical protein